MSGETEGLGHVYDVDGPEAAQNAYNDWAAGYDADNVGKGYRIPWLAAAFFARHVPLGSGPILDAGCGTGLVGEALSILGYDNVVGVDLSPEMLKLASSGPAGIAMMSFRMLGTQSSLGSGDLMVVRRGSNGREDKNERVDSERVAQNMILKILKKQ